jgi:hypothetical protein
MTDDLSQELASQPRDSPLTKPWRTNIDPWWCRTPRDRPSVLGAFQVGLGASHKLGYRASRDVPKRKSVCRFTYKVLLQEDPQPVPFQSIPEKLSLENSERGVCEGEVQIRCSRHINLYGQMAPK